MKCSNIRIIEVSEEEDKKTDHEKILEEIIVENFPKMGKEIITQVQETQRVPNRLLYPARISFKYEGEIKSFTDKQKLREFSTTKPALQQMLKDSL